MVVQGLAVKFGGPDQFASDELKIVTKRRYAQEYAEHAAHEEALNNSQMINTMG